VADSLLSLIVQCINGLASASTLYLVAVGLSIIFGVTRVVNFAHGAFFMLGLYAAIHINQGLQAIFALEGAAVLPRAVAYWGSMVLAAICVAALAAMLERFMLRRLYAVPELFQLLATFAWVLIAQDAVLYVWGAEEILGPRAPGLNGAVNFGGMLGERSVPAYDVLLIALAPAIGYALHLWLKRSTLGLHIRAASEDREMAQALGVRQGLLFCATFALGCGLAAFGGALQMPREPASTALALAVVGDAFVIVVIGGLGSLKGAYIAALAVGLLKALCLWLGTQTLLGMEVPFPKLVQVVEFLLMAGVLAFKPQGLFGKAGGANAALLAQEHTPLQPLKNSLKTALIAAFIGLVAFVAWLPQQSYVLTLLLDMGIAFLFAISLHWLLSPAGMPSFGHAALFGVGAYAVGVMPPAWGIAGGLLLAGTSAAGLGVVTALLTARMSGVYRAMLTLAIAQLLWSASYQWDGLTGGSNGLTGLWPAAPFDAAKPLLWLVLAVGVLVTVIAAWALRSRWGLQARALRDSPQRAASLGLPPLRLRVSSFAASGWVAGLAGALFAWTKGTVAPDVLSVHQSVNGLVMVLLGGVNSITGALSGAVLWTLAQDWLLRNVDYWRAALGAAILLMVLALPNGVSGWLERLSFRHSTAKRGKS
jgi:branched-chain amino acid transport system permease protein